MIVDCRSLALDPTARSDAIGLFIWDLRTDCLRGDQSIAEYFGFNETEVANGLSIQNYIARIAPEDREQVAAAIKHSLFEGPYNARYQIVRPDGTAIDVDAMGRCFFDFEGLPVYYVGLLAERRNQDENGQRLLQTLCQATYRQAGLVGRADIAEMLAPVMTALESGLHIRNDAIH